MMRTEMEKDVPMRVSLPIEVMSVDQAFPFLNATLADLGIHESAVKERVVWVDTKRTRVRSKSGKLKDKEVSVLEVRVKAQMPGQTKCQEVLYSTEAHTDRSYCRSGISFPLWTQAHPVGNEMVDMTLALDTKCPIEEEKTEDLTALQ